MYFNKFTKLIVVGTMCLSLTACSFGAKKENNKVAPIAQEVDETYFSYVEVAKGDVNVVFSTGVSYKKATAENLHFGINNAKISKTYVSEGDKVKVGDLLMECEATQVEQTIDMLNAEIVDYTANVEYYTKLVDIENKRKLLYTSYGKTYSDEDLNNYSKNLDDYTKKLNVSKIKLEEAQKTLEDCKIYATMNGSVKYIATTNKYTSLGNGETAITLFDDKAYFYANAKDENISLFKVGEEYTINGKKGKKKKKKDNVEEDPNNENFFIKVKCTSVDMMLNSSDEYVINFAPVDDIAFLDELSGFSCKINIITESAKDVLYIPKRNLITTGNGYCVYSQAQDGSRVLKPVEIGLIGTEFIEIKSGLTFGEQILSNTDKK